MSFIIILLISCFTPEPQVNSAADQAVVNYLLTKHAGQVSVPHDEVVITFIAE